MIAQGDAQLGALLALKRQLASASPATLAMVRAEIAACVATASGIAQQAQAATTGSAQGAAAELMAASSAARAVVTSFTHDFYEKKIFDPYLAFASAEDEKAYREREAVREKAIKDALALDTPEGNARALAISRDQLRDAGAHGADKSPDYQQLADGLASSDAQFKEKMGAAKAEQGRQERAAITGDVPATPTGEATITADLLAKLRKSGMTAATVEHGGHGLAVTDSDARQQALRT